MRLRRQDPGGWGRGGGRSGTRETPAKGLRGERVGRTGKGTGKGEGKGWRIREGVYGQAAVAAQAHLGERWEGARGLAQAHPQGRGDKPGLTLGR